MNVFLIKYMHLHAKLYPIRKVINVNDIFSLTIMVMITVGFCFRLYWMIIVATKTANIKNSKAINS